MKNRLKLELLREIGEIDFKSCKNPLLLLLALINSFMEENKLGKLIIVGGYAVELYTGGGYHTGDIDIIVEGNSRFLEDVLNVICEKPSRVWIPKDKILALKAIDIVSNVYGSQRKSPLRLEVDRYWIYIAPPEEVVISCLKACKYWESDIDCEKAAMVMAAQWNKIDWRYLEEKAATEKIAPLLQKIKATVEEVVKELS